MWFKSTVIYVKYGIIDKSTIALTIVALLTVILVNYGIIHRDFSQLCHFQPALLVMRWIIRCGKIS